MAKKEGKKEKAKRIISDTQTFSNGDSKHTQKDIDEAKTNFEKHISDFSFDPDYITRQCIEFGKFLTGIPIYGYQYNCAYRIIYAALTIEGAIITMLFSRQSGKSECMAFCVDTIAVLMPTLAKVFPELDQYKDGIKIGLFAPQQEQVNTTYSRCLSRINTENAALLLEDPEIEASLISESRLILDNGSFLKGQVAAKNSKIESKTYDIVIIEEAQDVDSFICQKSIEPMVSACVCGDSIIYDSFGTRHQIKDYFGDSIIGLNEKNNTIEVDSVTWLESRSQNKECFEIVFASGRTLRCSYDHPILVRERKGGMYGRKLHWLETKDLLPGLHVAVADKVDIFKGRKTMFDPRLVGMLIGDGSYRVDGMVRYCSCDEELLDYVKASYEFKSYNTYLTKSNKVFEDGTIKGLCSLLKNLGIYGQVGSNKTLPLNIDEYTYEDICSLIGGLYDTDGHVTIQNNRRGHIGLSSCSEALLDEVFYLLEKFGIHSRKIFKASTKTSFGKKGFWSLSICDKSSIVRFSEHFTFLVSYKQKTLDNLVGILKEHKEKRDVNYPNLIFDRVIEVIPMGVQEVYNLTADKNHTYLANGVVTHNTNGTIIKVGTTGTVKNHFWYDIQENKRLSRSQPPELAYHFEYNYKQVIAEKRRQYDIDKKIFHLNYEKDVLKKKTRWGEDSDAFRLGYALIWALDSGMFITDHDWDVMTNKKKGFTTKLDADDYVTAGLDIGKEQNSTVLTIVRSWLREPDDDSYTKEILAWFEWRGEDYDTLHYFVCDALVEYGVKVLVADYTGVGKAVVDRLAADLSSFMEIVPYTFSRESKSAMWQNLQGDIRGRRLIVPANKVVSATKEYKNFETQMKGLLKWYDGSYLVCQKGDSPDDRDDYCDSLGMAALAGNQRIEVDMEESSDNVFYGKLVSEYSRARNSSW